MSEQSLSFGSWVQKQTENRLKYGKEKLVRDALKAGNQRLVINDYGFVSQLVEEVLIPALLNTGSIREIRRWAKRVPDDHAYAAPELRRAVRTDGALPADSDETIQRAFASLQSIAIAQDIVDEELSNIATAMGYAIPIGRHRQKFDMSFGDPVNIITDQSGWVKTLFTGATGQAKTTSGEREIEDRYNHGLKVIDPVDIVEGENMLYDVPQQQDVLRNLREKFGYAPDFRDSDHLKDPNLEIYLPLTPGLTRERLPFDTQEEEFSIKPFTIPASDISETFLITLIDSQISKQMEMTIRTAYRDIDDREDDWSLKDLATEIRGRDEIDGAFRERVVRILHNLQSMGFIRTKSCPYAIEWSGIFEDTETITSFSAALLDEKYAKLMVTAYLIDRVIKLREKYDSLPPAVLVMRELHEIAGHQKEQAEDNRARELEKAIGGYLSANLRRNRHRRLEVIADTQDPGHLKKGVRKGFTRYVCFNLNRSSVQSVFEYTNNNKWKSFARSMGPEKGHAGVVGQVEPAVNHDDIEFVSPIQYIPPGFHHFDVDEDDTGWYARAEYLEDEELRRPAEVDGVDWPDEIPSGLVIHDPSEEKGPAVKNPMDQFVRQCINFEDGSSGRDPRKVAVKTQKVRDAYKSWAKATGASMDPVQAADRFGREFKSAFSEEQWGQIDNQQRGKEAKPHYVQVELTPVGQKYLQRYRSGGPSAQQAGAD